MKQENTAKIQNKLLQETTTKLESTEQINDHNSKNPSREEIFKNQNGIKFKISLWKTLLRE